MTAPKYSLKTLGCKANLYDSQLIETELRRRGWVPAEAGESADLCVVNSCTVTDEADRQSRKAASAASTGTGTRVVFTGCGAEVSPERIRSSGVADFVVGNQDKPRLVDLVLGAIGETENPRRSRILGSVSDYRDFLSRHPMDREWSAPEGAFHLPPVHRGGETDRRRGFLKIQEGCDSFCTYCIIPYGRGPSRSLPIPDLVRAVNELVDRGLREIVVTGTNIGDYGRDRSTNGRPTLEDLIESLLSETNLERLRISSLDPVEIGPRLRGLYSGNPRLCAHFHVSLQSPRSRILRLMKRKYSAEDVEECLRSIAELPAPIGGVYVGMDVIAGFPGETRDEFERGVERLRDLPWTRLHVFPYSERTGTPATRLPESVEPSERSRRAKILRALSLDRMKDVHRRILEESRTSGRILDRVLIESAVKGPNPDRKYVGGYSTNYLRVLLPVESAGSTESMKNRIVPVRAESILVDSSQGDVAFLGSISGPIG